MLKQRLKKWWFQLLVLIAMLIAMGVQDTSILYVSKIIWYSLMGAVGFCIFSIFKWG